MRQLLVGLLALHLFSAHAPTRLSAQSDLASVASAAAAAWTRHDFAGVVGGSRVEVRIPGVSASGPLPGEQVVALLMAYVRGAVEAEVTVTSAMVVSEVSGYAELRRRFRSAGVGVVQEEVVLLGFTRVRGAGGRAGRWEVGVVQVVGRGER